MAARKAKTIEEPKTELSEAQKQYQKLSETTLTVNGIEFPVREFTVMEAELYDLHYKKEGGQELDLERRVLQGEFEKLPKSKTLDVLNKRIVPLRQELREVEAEYEKEGTDELFSQMLELAAKLDPLEDQARRAIEHTDYDKVVRQTDEISQKADSITKRLQTIRHDFVYRLAQRDGKTAEPIERWRERATQGDLETASELVIAGNALIRLGRELNPQSETQPTSNASALN